VPAVSQAPIAGVTTSDVAEWVGIDGYNSADVCQAGIQETVQTAAHGATTVSFSAFDEWYPAGANIISASSFQVHAGDTIKVTVETAGAGATSAVFVFDDVTTGKIYDTSLSAPKGTSLQGNSAEVIVETPEFISGDHVSQPLLSDFLNSPIVFQNVSAAYKGGSAASLSSAQSIGMYTDQVPGSHSYVQEAFGSIQPGSDTVTVTENDYWPSARSNHVGLVGGHHSLIEHSLWV
jgi:Peptidase A4 family